MTMRTKSNYRNSRVALPEQDAKGVWSAARRSKTQGVPHSPNSSAGLPSHCRRRAALAVEAAIVYSVMLVLILGLIVGGIGVFRYQQVACQAREAARWTSVRGSDWQKETNQDSPTQDQILNAAVAPFAAGMDLSKITIRVQWVNQVTGEVIDWDKAAKHPRSLNAGNAYVTNTIRVTISYQWSPDLIFATMYLTSTCEIPMTF